MPQRGGEAIRFGGRAVHENDLVGPGDIGDEVSDGIAVHSRAAARLDDGPEGHGCSPTNSSPAVSAKPQATFMACTPLPAAPLVRLSIAHSATTRSPRGSAAKPTSAKFVPARSLGSGYR